MRWPPPIIILSLCAGCGAPGWVGRWDCVQLRGEEYPSDTEESREGYDGETETEIAHAEASLLLFGDGQGVMWQQGESRVELGDGTVYESRSGTVYALGVAEQGVSHLVLSALRTNPPSDIDCVLRDDELRCDEGSAEESAWVYVGDVDLR